jgi:hypothetical protein
MPLYTPVAMTRARRFDRWVRWITLMAVALATLTPSVSHALRHARGDTLPWSQLCSVTGGKRAVFDTPDSDQSPLRAHAFEHCVFCALHGGGPLPSAAATAPALRADLAHVRPAPSLRAPRLQPPWRLAQSRAPPVQA